jgi:hypothetical protein
VDPQALVDQWRLFDRANRACAVRRRNDGDLFGAELAIARAEVRREAADVLEFARDPLEAARQLHRRAAALWHHVLPLIGFDEAAVEYTQARAWQDCARAIDPLLPVVQPKITFDSDRGRD